MRRGFRYVAPPRPLETVVREADSPADALVVDVERFFARRDWYVECRTLLTTKVSLCTERNGVERLFARRD